MYVSVSVAVIVFPAASLASTFAFTVVSRAKSEPATSIAKLRSASTKPVFSTPFTVIVTVSPSLASPVTSPVIVMF